MMLDLSHIDNFPLRYWELFQVFAKIAFSGGRAVQGLRLISVWACRRKQILLFRCYSTAHIMIMRQPRVWGSIEKWEVMEKFFVKNAFGIKGPASRDLAILFYDKLVNGSDL